MNCPKCGKEMKLGAILGSQHFGIRWVPQNAIVGSYFVITKKAVERDGGFFLTENGAEYDGYMHPVASYVTVTFDGSPYGGLPSGLEGSGSANAVIGAMLKIITKARSQANSRELLLFIMQIFLSSRGFFGTR